MSRMSEINLEYETALNLIHEEMYEPPDISAAMAVRDLMSATSSLSEMAVGKSGLVRIEANDIELAYTRIGRILSHIRKPAIPMP